VLVDSELQFQQQPQFGQSSTGFSSDQAKINPEASEDIIRLAGLLDNLVPTKESIKVTKTWIMQRGNIAKDIASYIRARVEKTNDFEQKLNVIYLIHDILHHSTRNRPQQGPTEPITLDEFALAFEPHLSSILGAGYFGQPPENQEKITKVATISLQH
jgi:hypothetical protein